MVERANWVFELVEDFDIERGQPFTAFVATKVGHMKLQASFEGSASDKVVAKLLRIMANHIEKVEE